MGNFNIVISMQTLEKIQRYRNEIISNNEIMNKKYLKVMGKHLNETMFAYYKTENLSILHNYLKNISLEELTYLLIQSKQPHLSATSEVSVYGIIDWNETEASILGDMSIVAPVHIYDDGGQTPRVHRQPFQGHLLFTPAALLRNDRFGNRPDCKEITHENNIDDDKLYVLYERRLLPILKYANDAAFLKNRQAIITLPALGAGIFSGIFAGQMEKKLETVIRQILETHGDKLPNIRMIHYDPANQDENRREDVLVGNTIFRVRSRDAATPVLCHLEAYQEGQDNFSNCELFSVAEWDAYSWPGNEYMLGYRSQDGSTKAAATSLLSELTDHHGIYDINKKSYIPVGLYPNWAAVVKSKQLKLGSMGKIYVQNEGQIQQLQENELKEGLMGKAQDFLPELRLQPSVPVSITKAEPASGLFFKRTKTIGTAVQSEALQQNLLYRMHMRFVNKSIFNGNKEYQLGDFSKLYSQLNKADNYEKLDQAVNGRQLDNGLSDPGLKTSIDQENHTYFYLRATFLDQDPRDIKAQLIEYNAWKYQKEVAILSNKDIPHKKKHAEIIRALEHPVLYVEKPTWAFNL